MTEQVNETMFRWVIGGLVGIAGFIMYQLNTTQNKIDTLIVAVADMKADVKVLTAQQSASASAIGVLQGKLEVLGKHKGPL